MKGVLIAFIPSSLHQLDVSINYGRGFWSWVLPLRHSETADIDVESEKFKKAAEIYHDETLKRLQLEEVAHERYTGADMDTKVKMLRCVGSNDFFDGVTTSPKTTVLRIRRRAPD